MSCDLANGRLLAPCKSGLSGLKTVFFSPYPVTPTIDVDGQVSDLGTAEVYRFEMAVGNGDLTETLTSAEETGIAFITQVVNMVLQHIQNLDLPDLNSLIKGRWNIFVLDYENNTRCVGLYNGATATGGDGVSGTAPADAKTVTQTFSANENGYGQFLAPPAIPSTPYNPFEDMVGVTVTPAY